MGGVGAWWLSPGSPEGSCRSGWRWVTSHRSKDPDSWQDGASEPEADATKTDKKKKKKEKGTVKDEEHNQSVPDQD